MCVVIVPKLRTMATGQYHINILRTSRFFFSTLCILLCQTLFGLEAKQSFQSLVAENSAPKTSKVYPSTPPQSAIEISDPGRGTIWTVSETAKIQWETENIDTAKSIRFFLAKDDMVVQELGSFKTIPLPKASPWRKMSVRAINIRSLASNCFRITN